MFCVILRVEFAILAYIQRHHSTRFTCKIACAARSRSLRAPSRSSGCTNPPCVGGQGSGGWERGRYRGTSLIIKKRVLGPYNRTIPRALWWSLGGGGVLVCRAPLYWRHWRLTAPDGGQVSLSHTHTNFLSLTLSLSLTHTHTLTHSHTLSQMWPGTGGTCRCSRTW